MKVKIDKPFRSQKYQRIMNRGEVVDGDEDWVHKIEKEGLGTIIEPVVTTADIPMPRKRTKKVNKKQIETASLEVK